MTIIIDRLKQILGRFQSKTLLIGIAIILLVVNVARMAIGYYNEQQQQVAEKIALLDQYRVSTQKLNQLKNRVAGLKRQEQILDRYFFTGKSEEEISSAMQIKLQEMVTNAELEPEYIRPVTRGGGAVKSKDFGEIAVNLRLSGSIDKFAEFLKNLYKSQHLFKIESFSVKPFKKTELKIVLEVKGFYKIQAKG